MKIMKSNSFDVILLIIAVVVIIIATIGILATGTRIQNIENPIERGLVWVAFAIVFHALFHNNNK